MSAIPGGAMVIDASHGDYRAAGVLSSLTRGSDYRETAGGALELGGWGGLPAPRIAAPLVSSAAYCRGALVASERQTSPGVRVRLPQVVRLRALPHLGLREPLDIVIETDDVGFLAQSVDLEIYFVLFLIGILIVVELIDTISATPRYLANLRYIIAIGVVLFGWIVATKVLEILAS